MFSTTPKEERVAPVNRIASYLLPAEKESAPPVTPPMPPDEHGATSLLISMLSMVIVTPLLVLGVGIALSALVPAVFVALVFIAVALMPALAVLLGILVTCNLDDDVE